VAFTPNFSESDSSTLDQMIALRPTTATIIDSAISVELVDNVGLNRVDTLLLYQVEYSTTPVLTSFWFAVSGNGTTVDLNTVTRVPPSGQIIDPTSRWYHPPRHPTAVRPTAWRPGRKTAVNGAPVPDPREASPFSRL
jgi:hypothetical protein